MPCCRCRPSHSAYGGHTVVHDITFDLAPHECLALVGESGSGKTTLARSIAGLHRERRGAILLQRRAAGRRPRGAARARPAG